MSGTPLLAPSWRSVTTHASAATRCSEGWPNGADKLKSGMGLEHTRHRSPINAFVHTLSCPINRLLKEILENSPSPQRPGPGINIDSRRLLAGEMFLNLRGENFDEHHYLTEAAAGGLRHHCGRHGSTPPPASASVASGRHPSGLPGSGPGLAPPVGAAPGGGNGIRRQSHDARLETSLLL